MAMIQFNMKVSQESFDTFNRLMEESDCQTKNQFLEDVLEKYQTRGKAVSNEADKKLIQEQNEIIEKISNRSIDLEEQNIRLESDYINLKETYQKLLNEHDNLNVLNAGMKLNENQIVLTMNPPYLKQFIDVAVLKCSKRLGRPITAGDMFAAWFWEHVRKGVSDFMPLFSDSEVDAVVYKYRQELRLRQEAAENGN